MNQEYELGLPKDKIGGAINKKIETFYSYLTSSGIMGMWRKSNYQYFAGYYEGGEIGIDGIDGEYTSVNVNDYRNFIQHIAILITSYDPTWEVSSTNTDKKSQLQSILIPGLLKYYNEYGGSKEAAFKAAEYLMAYADAYLVTEWDETIGEPYTSKPSRVIDFDGNKTESNVPVMSGDVIVKAKMPVDVVFDIGQKDFSENRWYIVRDYVSKFELAARYPDVSEEIISVTTTFDYRMDIDFEMISQSALDTDYIPTWTLYHDQSPAMPFGRKTIVCGSQCNIVLEDGILPYREMPVSRVTSTYIHRMPIGYQFTYDLLSLVQYKKSLNSIIATNLTMFGVGNILAPSGTKIDVNQLSKGLNYIEYQPGLGEPKAINFSLPQGEHMNAVKMIDGSMQSLVSLSDISRGGTGESGKAIAAMQAQTIQFSSRHQRALVDALKLTACHTIDILRRKMPKSRKAKFLGKVPSQYIDSFDKEDLDGDYEIILNIGDPSTQTAAGKQAKADNLLQYGEITKDEYFMISKTGNLDAGTEFQVAEQLRLKSDQEQLMNMGMPIILWTDDHQKFINMALGLLNLPGIVENEELVSVITEYIQLRVDLSVNTDPNKLMAIGRKPIQQLQAPMPPPMLPPPPPGVGNMEQPGQPPLPGVPDGLALPNNPIDGKPMVVPSPMGAPSSNIQ